MIEGDPGQDGGLDEATKHMVIGAMVASARNEEHY